MNSWQVLGARVDRFLLHVKEADQALHYYPEVFSPSTSRIVLRTPGMDGPREFENFATSNYLGMGQRPEVQEAVREALGRYGTGAHGSPVLSGYFAVHRELEAELVALHGGAGEAVLYNSGIAANIGCLSTILESKDVLLLDECCHGSLFDGGRLAGATIRTHRHRDMEELRFLLGKFCHPDRVVVVATCGVFSMSGNVAPLRETVEAVHEAGALLMLDDAHGFGVLGKSGRGTLEHLGLPEDACDIRMGTMSKALGAMGGYIVTTPRLARMLRFRCRLHMLTASISPAIAAGCLAAARILRQEGEVLTGDLRRRAALFRDCLVAAGLDVMGQAEVPVVPVRLSSEEKIWPVTVRLRERGIFINPVIAPAVPLGEGRLRFSVTLDHDLERLEAAARVVVDSIRAEGG